MVRYREILKLLHDHQVEFIVIGGVAVTLHGVDQGTLDVDVCAPLHDENLSRIIEALRGLNPRWRFRIDKVFPVDNAEKFRGFKNLYIRTDWGDLDILGELAPHGVYDDVKEKFVEYDLDGFKCRVLDINALLAIKRFVGRQRQDRRNALRGAHSAEESQFLRRSASKRTQPLIRYRMRRARPSTPSDWSRR